MRKGGEKEMDVTTIIVAASIPSAITGFCFWILESRMARRQKEADKKYDARR